MGDKITKAQSSKVLKELREARIQEEIERLTQGMLLTKEERQMFEKIVRSADAMNVDNIYTNNNSVHKAPQKTKHKNPFKSLKRNAGNLISKVDRGARIAKNYVRHAINDHKQGRER